MTVNRHRSVELPPSPAGASGYPEALAGAPAVALLPGGTRAAVEPVFVPQDRISAFVPAGPGTPAGDMSGDPGTNPHVTGTAFSTRERCDVGRSAGHGDPEVTVGEPAGPRALPSLPSGPFTADVTVAMADDAGNAAGGGFAFGTTRPGDG